MDVIEVSYTGDILAHRRCSRSWAFEKYVGFRPYEQIQAMEGQLVHHGMEWLTRQYILSGKQEHATAEATRTHLDQFFSILWARGIKTAFADKQTTLDRVIGNLFPGGAMHPTVRAVVEGALHEEYSIKAVRKVLPGAFGGKSRILLTGIVDLVVQQEHVVAYEREWRWTNLEAMLGALDKRRSQGETGDVEIWDYKASRASTPHLADYARQVLTYAALYRDSAGVLPARCVIFFLNERNRAEQLVSVEVSEDAVTAALRWTEEQVARLRATMRAFELNPSGVQGGELDLADAPAGDRITSELKAQCTTCSVRFDCTSYAASLGPKKRDIDIYDVTKN